MLRGDVDVIIVLTDQLFLSDVPFVRTSRHVESVGWYLRHTPGVANRFGGLPVIIYHTATTEKKQFGEVKNRRPCGVRRHIRTEQLRLYVGRQPDIVLVTSVLCLTVFKVNILFTTTERDSVGQVRRRAAAFMPPAITHTKKGNEQTQLDTVDKVQWFYKFSEK